MIERREIKDREEWKRWRRADVATASTVGALFGHHPFTTALKLFVQARGVEFDETETKLMKKGRIIEHSVPAAVREERPEWIVEPAGCYLRDPDLRLGATPDFFVTDPGRGHGVLQAKTTGHDIFEREWDNGRVIPPWIVDQTLTEALLAEAEFAAVVVLIVDRYSLDCHIIDLPIDPIRQARIVAAVTKFRDDVLAGREPQPDFEKDSEVIKALAPHEVEGMIYDATGRNDLPDLLARRAALKERMRLDKAATEVIETELRFLMGECERIDGLSGWGVTYRTENHKGYSVEPSQPRVLRIYDRRDREEA
jgi:hypothetical protein